MFAFTQDDLLAELEKDSGKETEYTFATFKGTRLANGHTIETKNAGSLEFIFAHRFGAINGGGMKCLGWMKLLLDWVWTMELPIGYLLVLVEILLIKPWIVMSKLEPLRQSSGAKNFPFSATVLLGGAYKFRQKITSMFHPSLKTSTDFRIPPKY